MENLFQPEFIRVYGPALTYLALAAGLWLAITAAYLPGAGLPELGALLALSLAVIGLTTFPVNFLGLILMVAGTALFMALLYYRKVWWLPIAGIILQLGGSVLLFWGDQRLPILLVLAALAAAMAYHQIILMPGLRIQARARQTGPDTLIGALGEVTTTLDPVGTVRLQGATWTARADGVIESGRKVRVVGRRGLELQVVSAEPPLSEQ